MNTLQAAVGHFISYKYLFFIKLFFHNWKSEFAVCDADNSGKFIKILKMSHETIVHEIPHG